MSMGALVPYVDPNENMGQTGTYQPVNQGMNFAPPAQAMLQGDPRTMDPRNVGALGVEPSTVATAGMTLKPGASAAMGKPPNFNEIVRGKIWLGNAVGAETIEIMQQLGITHILNMAAEHVQDPRTQGMVRYQHCTCKDVEGEDISPWFPHVYWFLDDAVRSGGRAYVHCHMGRSRGSSAVIYYLMVTKQMSFEEAFRYAKEKRDLVLPNYGYAATLVHYAHTGAGPSEVTPIRTSKGVVIKDMQFVCRNYLGISASKSQVEQSLQEHGGNIYLTLFSYKRNAMGPQKRPQQPQQMPQQMPQQQPQPQPQPQPQQQFGTQYPTGRQSGGYDPGVSYTQKFSNQMQPAAAPAFNPGLTMPVYGGGTGTPMAIAAPPAYQPHEQFQQQHYPQQQQYPGYGGAPTGRASGGGAYSGQGQANYDPERRMKRSFSLPSLFGGGRKK